MPILSASWAAETLRVPPGHPRSGQPMALPPFAVAWLRASCDAHESALSTGRKNAKSAIAAVVCLGYLCGPLRRMATAAPNFWIVAPGRSKSCGPARDRADRAAVRAFQRAVLTRTLATVKNYSLTNAIAESTIRRDGNGNPALDQARSGGRIDVLSAAVLAVGEAALCPAPVPMAVYTLTASA